ncbi:MAG: AMP-binding protein [Nitrosopumilaceae archaeon]
MDRYLCGKYNQKVNMVIPTSCFTCLRQVRVDFHTISAVATGERNLTYSELDTLSSQLAKVIRARGVRMGERVGIFLYPSLASVVNVFTIQKSGACYVPVDPLPS